MRSNAAGSTMITLYTFGPAFGLPDPSPFVTKAEMLLKLAGLPYQTNTKGFRKAPKGKLPYIEDAGTIIPDSTFIRWHLEQKYHVDFDRGGRPPNAASPGRWKNCSRTTCTGRSSTRAGSTMRISPRGPRCFFVRCRRRCVRLSKR